MRFVLSILILLFLVFAFPTALFAQFEQVQRLDISNLVDDLYGIATNPEEEIIYIMNLRQCTVCILNEDLDEVIDRVQLNEPQDIYGMDYNPEDNTWWCADRRNNNIYHYDIEGELLNSFASGGNSNGVCYCPTTETIFVAEHPGGIREMTVEGELIERHIDNISLTAIEYYPPNNSLLVMEGNDRVYEYSLEGERLAVIFGNDLIDGNGLGLDYNPRTRLLYCTGREGIVHIFEDRHSAVPAITIEPEAFDVQVGMGLIGEETLVVTNTGEEESRLMFSIEITGEGIDWLEVEPVEAELANDEAIEVELTISTDELQPGQFERNLIISSNDPENNRLEVPVDLTVIAGFGELRGIVVDHSNDEPIPGALISIPRFDFERQADENGEFRFEEIPEWVYTVEATAEDFLPMTLEEVEVTEDEVTEVEIRMLHSVFDLSADEVPRILPPDQQEEINLELQNPGNGQLSWTVEIEFPMGADVDRWEIRNGFDAEEAVQNNRLGGVEFIDDHYYIAGGIRGEDNQIYVVSREGEVARQFAQAGESNYGYRGLAYDGEHLWGCDDGIIYGFTTEGEVIAEFECPIGSTRPITWDPDRELLWTCNVTTDIAGINRDGEQVVLIDRPDQGLHVYGLGYYRDDPDDCNLYLFCRDGETDRQVWKMNLENGQVFLEAEPEFEGRAGTVSINQRWDPRSWVFITLTSSPDRVEVLHLDSPTGWIGINPVEGAVEAGESSELAVLFDTQGLPLNLEFTCDFVFTHNGVGGETTVPVSLMATEGNVHTDRTLELDLGWNLVSVNLDPDEHNVIELTRPLTDEDLLDLMKDGMGRFYNPEFNFNNIPGWFAPQGYLIKVNEECQLTIEGTSVFPDDPIDLIDGWQMVSYYPRIDVEATVALSGIRDQLLIAKDGGGHFYVPEWDFSNMGDMSEGNGYMLKMDGEAELVYRLREEGNEVFSSAESAKPSRFSEPKPTGVNMSLLVLAEQIPEFEGVEVGAFADDRCIGAGVLQNGKCGIALWGDDPTTPKVDGAKESQNWDIRIFDGERECVSEFEAVQGSDRYETDAFSVIRLTEKSVPPLKFGIESAYPNPFNAQTSIRFAMKETGDASLRVYDLTGKEVASLIDGKVDAGVHKRVWNAESFSAGVYFIQMAADVETSRAKVVLVK